MAWEQNGNAINANQWLGTRNPLPLMIRTNNNGQAVGAQPPLDDQEAMRITPFQPGAAPQRGRVGIWTDAPNRALHVQGTEIHSGGPGAGYSFGNRETAAFVEIPGNGERWLWYATRGTARLWSGTDKIAVTPAGNVGIGTPSPSQKLELNFGNILLPNAVGGTSGNVYFGGPTDTGQLGMRLFGGRVNPGPNEIHAAFIDVKTDNAADGLRIRVDTVNGGTERMRVTAGGSVGIGTPTPDRRLHVEGSEIHSGGGGAGYSFGNRETVPFIEDPGSGERWLWYASGGTARLWSGSDKLAVTSGGNVGIGTTTPGSNYKLNVVGSINATDIHRNGAPLVGSQWANVTGGISYTAGNVGIGTTTPRQKLSVLSRSLLFGEGILTAANLDLTGDAVAISGIIGTSGAQTGTGGPVAVLGSVMSGAEATAKGIVGWTADSSRQYAGFFVGRGWFGGNVGIGIGAQNPAFMLDVAGSAHASSFPTSSDARLKTNVKQLTNVLERLERIRGVSFEWNELSDSLDRSTDRTEVGVIAQEVEAEFPELVTTWGREDYRAVDYGRLTGILVEAVKELRAEIKELRAENRAIAARRLVLHKPR